MKKSIPALMPKAIKILTENSAQYHFHPIDDTVIVIDSASVSCLQAITRNRLFLEIFDGIATIQTTRI